ncbi:MAG: glutathione S-transferase N-terminal domain-containing protein [Deltaproteobacteria bacterium]|nr:glutathione S-transferase N-terminal domain-containing protein [Nannocystaceae bacterium]
MIDAYVWSTPNGYKAIIALEELGLQYTPHWVNIGKGEQHQPEFLAVNPNGKIPAIVDRDAANGPITVFESGAILIYLADKAQALLPAEGAARYQVFEWVFFNAGGTGPMIGQLGYFAKSAKEKIPHAIDRFTKEVERLLGVLDVRLGEARYLAGEFSIADLMNVTWARAAGSRIGMDLSVYPNLTRWLDEVEARPAVKRGLAMKPPS